MIDLKEIKEIAENTFLDNANVNLYLFENKKTQKDPLLVHDLNINEEISKQIRLLSREYIRSIIKQVGTLVAIPDYNPDAEQSLFKIESRKVKMFADLYEHIMGRKKRLPYKRSTVDDDKLVAWIFRFEGIVDKKIEQMLFIQRFQPAKMLGSKGVTIFESGQAFKLLGKNILHFNLGMDLLFFRDTFVVTRTPSSFEYIFGFEDYYRENAVQLVRALSEQAAVKLDFNLRFQDINLVNQKITSNSRLARRLYSARVNGYYSEISYKKLAALNKKYKLQLKLDPDKKEWLIDDQADLQVMARIFNDDYEMSQLTDNEYIALSKKKL